MVRISPSWTSCGLFADRWVTSRGLWRGRRRTASGRPARPSRSPRHPRWAHLDDVEVAVRNVGLDVDQIPQVLGHAPAPRVRCGGYLSRAEPSKPACPSMRRAPAGVTDPCRSDESSARDRRLRSSCPRSRSPLPIRHLARKGGDGLDGVTDLQSGWGIAARPSTAGTATTSPAWFTRPLHRASARATTDGSYRGGITPTRARKSRGG